MEKIKKGYNAKVILIAISIVLICNSILYSCPDIQGNLRVPIGEQKTYARMSIMANLNLLLDELHIQDKEVIGKNFNDWSLREIDGAVEYLDQKLDLTQIGRYLKEEMKNLLPILLTRIFYNSTLDEGRRKQADEYIERMLRKDPDFLGDNEVISFLFMISDGVRLMDKKVIDAYSGRQDFNSLARYYFEQYKRKGESYSEGAILLSMERAKSSEWYKRVEQAVIMALANSRSDSFDAVPFNEMPQPVKDIINDAQKLFDRYFPKLLGRVFPLNLKETVFLTPEHIDHADCISKRVYLYRDGIHNLRTFIRFVIHENIHLLANDDSFIRYDINALQEGLIEYLTQRIFDLAEQDGLTIKYEFQSETYTEWVWAMKRIIFDYLFEGNDSPFIDFYNSGNIIALAKELSSAIEKKEGKALEKIPYMHQKQIIIQEIEKIVSLLRPPSLKDLFKEDREILIAL